MTHKTTRYPILVEETNCNYQPVAVMFSIDETLDTIKTMLEDVKNRNPQYHPTHVMCDYCGEEIRAVKSVFRRGAYNGLSYNGAKVLICKFHYSQTWN